MRSIPTWDPQGNYLYFISNREFAPQISNIEFNYATNRDSYLYAVALRKDVKHPFPPESDEVTVSKEAPKPEGPPAEPAKEQATPAKQSRMRLPNRRPSCRSILTVSDRASLACPLGADNYGGLAAKTGHLLYVAGPAFYYGRQGDRPAQLKIFSFKDRKETVLADDIRGYAMSDDGGKVLVATGSRLQPVRCHSAGRQNQKACLYRGLVVDRVPAEEWTQIFNEVWRRYRDFFYVSNMHGYDWPALREQYKPLLQYVAHRSDLNYVISEMVSELNVQHAYIEGGDFLIPPRPRVGLPGARFELDQQAGRYRIQQDL